MIVRLDESQFVSQGHNPNRGENRESHMFTRVFSTVVTLATLVFYYVKSSYPPITRPSLLLPTIQIIVQIEIDE